MAHQQLPVSSHFIRAALEASGTVSASVRDIANAQMLRAGVNVVSLFDIVGELMRDWRHSPGAQELFPWIDKYMPSYSYVARAHKYAIRNGTVLPGEDIIPN